MKILENIAALDKACLDKIGVTAARLWNEERMFPDESDDESYNEIEKVTGSHSDEKELYESDATSIFDITHEV